MIFSTHEKTPKPKTSKTVKLLLFFSSALLIAFFLFSAIITSIYIKSINPALIILIPMIILAFFFIITTFDMNRAHIIINKNSVTVVDYYFLFRKEFIVPIQDIKKAEIKPGYSFGIHGYRYSMAGFSYIVFSGENNKYLFKIINYPETYKYFSQYLGV